MQKYELDDDEDEAPPLVGKYTLDDDDDDAPTLVEVFTILVRARVRARADQDVAFSPLMFLLRRQKRERRRRRRGTKTAMRTGNALARRFGQSATTFSGLRCRP